MKLKSVHEKCFMMSNVFGTCGPTSKICINLTLHAAIFIMLLFRVAIGLRDINMRENISLAQCRVNCLQRLNSKTASSKDEECKMNTDCNMCWNSCRLFLGNSPAKSTLCSDHTACFPGCQTACRFYDDSSPKNLTPPMADPLTPLPARMASPKLGEGGLLTWSPPSWPIRNPAASPSHDILYVVMTNSSGIWKELGQTSGNKITISETSENAGVKVLAVSSSGLIAVVECCREEEADRSRVAGGQVPSSLTTTTTTPPLFIQNPADQDTVGSVNDAYLESKQRKYSYDYDQSPPDPQPPSVPVDHSWEIKLELLSIDLLASVKVSWDVRGSGLVDYMVTWSESAGGISGHLVTKQSEAEISLWSSQHYSVQVQLLDQHGNSVLQSMASTISFGPDDSSKTFASTSKATPKSMSTTTTTTTTPRSSTFSYHKISTESLPPLIRKKEISTTWKGIHVKDEGKTPTTTARPFPRPTPPQWKIDNRYNHNTLTNSKEEVTLTDTSSSSGSSSPLMTWAACLGVGAVVILLLIIWAVRTLRKNNSQRQESRRAEDYLSETTASSVNSSGAVTTCSHLSRGTTRDVEDPPWSYETFYRINSQPPGRLGIPRLPPPIHSPPSPPMQQHMHSTPTCHHVENSLPNIMAPSFPQVNTAHIVNTSSHNSHTCYGNL